MNMIVEFSKNGESRTKDSVDGLKKLMRQRCQKIAAGLEPTYVHAASAAIAARVLDSEEYRTARTIFCYLHMNKEPETDLLIAQALADGKRVGIPLCTGPHEMVAKRYRAGDELRAGAYGIREPLESAAGIPREEIDLAIIPCLACDRNGRRIGHGGGYYDVFLEGMNCDKIALCFEPLIMGNVPWYRTDVLMDAVATDENIYGWRWREAQGQTPHMLPYR